MSECTKSAGLLEPVARVTFPTTIWHPADPSSAICFTSPPIMCGTVRIIEWGKMAGLEALRQKIEKRKIWLLHFFFFFSGFGGYILLLLPPLIASKPINFSSGSSSAGIYIYIFLDRQYRTIFIDFSIFSFPSFFVEASTNPPPQKDSLHRQAYMLSTPSPPRPPMKSPYNDLWCPIPGLEFRAGVRVKAFSPTGMVLGDLTLGCVVMGEAAGF